MSVIDSKITLITPDDDGNNLKEGDIISFGKLTDDNYHAILLYEYGIKTYGKNSIFELLKECYMPNVFAYFLTQYYDSVVLLNTSERKRGRGGLLYLPEELSQNQKKSVNKVIKQLNGYILEINRDLKYVDGFVESDRYKITSDGEIEVFPIDKNTKKKGLSL